MENQFQEFIRVIDSLTRENVDYILIGGVACILHGLDRLTRDVDIFIKLETENIARLRKALHAIYKDESIEEITFDDLKKYQVIRYGTPDEFYIDLMAEIGTAFSFNDLSFETIEYKGIKIKIATPETLYKMKKDTLRDQDKWDANFLNELIKQRNSSNKH